MADNQNTFKENDPFDSEANHRGVLDAGGKVVAVCSEEYLVTLILELLRARSFPLVKRVRAQDVGDQILRLQFICTEIHRLFRHSELFPSPVVKARVAAIVASDANLQFVQAVKELLMRDIMADLALHSRFRTRPTYQLGSKGWENFLLNMAPGLPLKHLRVTTTPKSSYQIIPITGMRIVGDANREDQMLATWITNTPVPLDVEPAVTTKLLDLDKPDEHERAPNLLLSQQSYDVFLRPNPFQEHLRLRLDLPGHGPERLEDYSPFIGRLDSPPIPPNQPIATLNAPNIFPVIPVRSWHPPTKLGDIRYHRTAEGNSTSQQGTHSDVRAHPDLSTLAADQFMDTMIDWDAIEADAKFVHNSISENPIETLKFDSAAERAQFQAEMNHALAMFVVFTAQVVGFEVLPPATRTSAPHSPYNFNVT